MRTIFFLIALLFLTACGGGNEKNTRSMEPPPQQSPPPPPPSPPQGCEKFKTSDDCVLAKEINFTLAYFMGSKGDTQVFSISKMDNSRPQITKIKTSAELDEIKNRFNTEKYAPAGERSATSIEDLIQFIQDDMEGQGSGRTAVQVRNDRNLAIKAAEEKRKLEQSEANKRAIEKLQKEIDAYPYLFELSCMSNIDDSKLEIELCGAKLKPVLKVVPDNKPIYNYSYMDFISGTLNSAFKLPKEFSFELNSTAQDSSKLMVVVIKQRVLKDDPSGKVIIGTGKVYSKMGQNMTFVP